MTTLDASTVLHQYLQRGREALLWKLDGLGEYDLRRPLVPTGTNLLGLVKHVSGTEAEYLGLVFDRPFPEPLPWMADESPDNADMWATVDESRDAIVERYRRVWAHSDATLTELPLDAEGRVPWWPADRSLVSLQQILVHVIAETHRHAGHADLVRELVDGTAGMSVQSSNLPSTDAVYWQAHRDQVEAAAREVAGR